jgi:hypothetical protein
MIKTVNLIIKIRKFPMLISILNNKPYIQDPLSCRVVWMDVEIRFTPAKVLVVITVIPASGIFPVYIDMGLLTRNPLVKKAP